MKSMTVCVTIELHSLVAAIFTDRDQLELITNDERSGLEWRTRD